MYIEQNNSAKKHLLLANRKIIPIFPFKSYPRLMVALCPVSTCHANMHLEKAFILKYFSFPSLRNIHSQRLAGKRGFVL